MDKERAKGEREREREREIEREAERGRELGVRVVVTSCPNKATKGEKEKVFVLLYKPELNPSVGGNP